MNMYEDTARKELLRWQKEMQRNPSLTNRLAKKLQDKINKVISEKVHKTITTVIKQMIRGVLFAAGATTAKPEKMHSLTITEAAVKDSIEIYKKTAAAEGGITGAGGIILTFADFPLLIAIKIKMLFDIAAKYGFDTGDYKERLYILHIFQLTFCSHEQRNKVYQKMTDWNANAAALPADVNEFDWRSFQQEYRDYIDLAKLAQLIPIIGAAVGFVVNYRLLKKLGVTAMNAYRMRLFNDQKLLST